MLRREFPPSQGNGPVDRNHLVLKLSKNGLVRRFEICPSRPEWKQRRAAAEFAERDDAQKEFRLRCGIEPIAETGVRRDTAGFADCVGIE